MRLLRIEYEILQSIYRPLTIHFNNLLQKCVQYSLFHIRCDKGSFFLNPVNTNIIKDYSQFVDQPMDFTQISQRIKSNFYTSIQLIRNDFELIWKNCYAYNGMENPYSKAAAKIQILYGSLESELVLHLDKLGLENGVLTAAFIPECFSNKAILKPVIQDDENNDNSGSNSKVLVEM